MLTPKCRGDIGTEISDVKNKILKKGTNGAVREDFFEDKLGTMTRKDVAEKLGYYGFYYGESLVDIDLPFHLIQMLSFL